MQWIATLLVAPLWGLLSTQLFLQSWLALANFVMAFLAFLMANVPRKQNAMYMGVSIASAILFSGLLYGGDLLLTDVLRFGQTKTEIIVYWVFAVLSAVYMLPRIPSKIRKSWRNAMVPGSLEADILSRKLQDIQLQDD